MGGDDSKLLRRVYAEALKRDPEERDEYLEEACRDRPDLRARVVELLAHADELLDGTRSASEGRTTSTGPQPRSGPEASEPRQIGSYIIRREIGRGGMGIVYLADDTRLQRRVALKALNPNLNQRPDLRERLRNEARLAGGLTHPNIATIYALEEIDNELYMACEFVPGTPLRDLLKSGPVAIEDVVNIGLQISKALAEAHTKHIVHRDLKPENVIRTPSGVVKVLDFGLAREEYSAHERLTLTGMIVGTPAYLSPEQVRGELADFRTDLFALGVLMYELASGINPFVDKSLSATFARIVDQDPAPLSQVQPRSVSSLDHVVQICLSKDPGRRYQSTQELIVNLERVNDELARRRSTDVDNLPAPAPRPSPAEAVRWLALHQLAVSVVYPATLYPAWYAKGWLPDPWGLTFVLAVLATAAAATSLRLHLWFMATRFPERLLEQYARNVGVARACDVIFASSQIAAAIAIGGRHPEFAMLFVGIATAMLVVSFVVEPATAAAVSGPARRV